MIVLRKLILFYFFKAIFVSICCSRWFPLFSQFVSLWDSVFLSSVSVFFAEMSLRPNARVEVRKKGYKLAVDADEARRKREDNMVEIRKNKRDESLLKKRREGLQQPQQQLFSSSSQAVDMEKKVKHDPANRMCNSFLYLSYNNVLQHYFCSSMPASYAVQRISPTPGNVLSLIVCIFFGSF